MSNDRDDGTRPKLRVVAGGDTPVRREEDALVAAFLVGDDEAFGELVRLNERLVLAIVRRYARTPEDARDLSQRTFLRAFEAARWALRRGRRNGVPFRRWLVRVAVNLAKNHVRDEARFARAPLEAIGADGATQPAGADGVQRAERVRLLRAAVLELPRRQREVLTLRVDAELPFAEIADALGITENSAKVSFHHATRKLRDVLGGKETP